MIDYDKMPPAAAAEAKSRLKTEHKKQGNKYHAQATVYNGVRYDSKAEAKQAADLDLLKSSGKVVWWLRQAWIPLGPDFGTRVDFLVGRACSAASATEKIVRVYAVEVKGVETPQFRKIRKLWPKYAPFSLHIIKCGELEIIDPIGA